MPPFIPASPAELTPAWVTTAMRDAGVLPRGRVAGLEIEPLSGGGIGFTGETVRVRLRYEGTVDAPGSVVAKFPTSDRQNRGMLESFDAYAREIRFYRHWAHRMPCATPTHLGSAYDGAGTRLTGPRVSRLIDALPARVHLALTRDVTRFMRASRRRYALLIEDLGPGVTVHDLADPPPTDELRRALSALAAVHATFWDDPALAGDDTFRPILTTTPALYRSVGHGRTLAYARAYSHWMDDADEARIRDALDAFADDVALVNRPRTLVHGDPRSDNLLFRPDGEVVLLDWSLAGHAHPGFDVGYLLSSCLDADRLAEGDELIRGYEAELAARGVNLDGGELRSVVAATYRGLAVQHLMSLEVLNGETYGGSSIYDLWMPRIVAGLAHDW